MKHFHPAISALFPSLLAALCVIGTATAAEPVTPSQTPGRSTGVWVFSCDGQFVGIRPGADGISETGSLKDVIAKRTSGRYDGCLVESVKSALKTPTLVVVVPHENLLNARGKRHYAVLGLNRSSLVLVNRFDIAPWQEQVPDVAMSTTGSLLKIVYESEGRGQRGALVSQDLYVSSFTSKGNTQNLAPETLRRSQKFFFRDDGVVQTGGGIGFAAGSLDSMGPQAAFEYSKRVLGRDVSSSTPIAPVDSAFGVILYIDGWDTKAKPVKNGRLIAFDTIERQVINGFETPFALAPFDGSRNTPNVHVTPDGTVAIIEEYVWSQAADSPSKIRVKTGLLAAYEIRSGVLLGKVTIPAASGSGYVVDFSDDGKNIFYATSEKFYVIDTTSMSVTSTTALPSGFSPIAAVAAQ